MVLMLWIIKAHSGKVLSKMQLHSLNLFFKNELAVKQLEVVAAFAAVLLNQQ